MKHKRILAEYTHHSLKSALRVLLPSCQEPLRQSGPKDCGGMTDRSSQLIWGYMLGNAWHS